MYEDKWAGLCTRCGAPTHEVIQKFPNDHPYAGKAMVLGKKTGRRFHMLLTDGSQMPLSFCNDCEPDDYPRLWALIIRAFEREQSDEYRKNMNLAPYNDKQKKTVRSFMDRMRRTAILGIHGTD